MNSLSRVWNYKNIVTTETMAITTKKITVIVEGIDDVKKFNVIKQSVNNKIQIKQIGIFEGYSNKKGAEYVMDFIEKMEAHHKNNKQNYIGYVLGIVDRDSICYKRKENKDRETLYVLEYYSLESFYINKEVIEKTLPQIVINPDLITKEIIDNFFNDIYEQSIDKLYYISLEALRKSCQSNYNAIVGYKPDKVDNFLENQEFLNKKEELEKFAKDNNYSRDMALKIIKGKWFISTFCSIYFEKIKELEILCNEGKINKCDCCMIPEATEPCLYKPKDNKLNTHILEEKLYGLFDLKSLKPIKERFKQLNNLN